LSCLAGSSGVNIGRGKLPCQLQARKTRGPFWIMAAGSIAILSLAPMAVAQDAFTVQLLTPLSATSNHKGDAVRATAVSPASFQGDTVQGQLTEVRASSGQSILQFNFVSLLQGGGAVPVASTVTSIANSQGQPGVDEQGHPIAASNPAPSESPAKSRLGSRLGGMLGGQAGVQMHRTLAVRLPSRISGLAHRGRV